MKARLEFDVEKPEELREALSPSLDSNEKVSYNIDSDENSTTVKVSADGLGALRGSTDTVFRLASLSQKIRRM